MSSPARPGLAGGGSDVAPDFYVYVTSYLVPGGTPEPETETVT